MFAKTFAVVLSMVLAFVVGVIAANHCPLVSHLSGGPCEAIVKHCCEKHGCQDDCCPCKP